MSASVATLSVRAWRAVTTAAAAVALLLLLLTGADSARAQHPDTSHCGTETGGGPLSGFMSHEEVGEALQRVVHTSRGRVSVDVAGFTNQGREIWAARVGHGDQVMLVQSAIHGNEQHGTRGLIDLVSMIGGSSSRAKQIREEITLVAIPNLNADGASIPRRQNVMPWTDVMALHPQLAAQPRAWYYSNGAGGFDVNRDFRADLDYEPSSADLPGSSTGFGFYITPEARTVREVYGGLEAELGRVDVFIDLHGQAACYGHGLPAEVSIDGPSSAAGTYEAAGASFGPEPSEEGLAGNVVLVNDGSANPTLGCDPLVGFPAGAIALIDRGSCTFVQKARNAQAAGAVAVVLVNDRAGDPSEPSGNDASITIPVVQVSQADGQTIKSGLPATGRVSHDPDSDYYTPLSLSGRFMTDPTAHGDWPDFDDDASRRATLAAYDALQGRGNSPYGKVTLYPQPPATDIPGTALGSFALRGSASVLFEVSGQTQQVGLKRMGMLATQVQVGLTGIVDALTDGTFDGIDPNRYSDIPIRVDDPG
ncbi:MAG TPA: PA domain-containing protein [Microbacterium sp.]|nr:PA domain-containing protein [Microbacterium sp.]